MEFFFLISHIELISFELTTHKFFFFVLDGMLFAGDGFFVHVSVLSELYITQLYILVEIKKAVKVR